MTQDNIHTQRPNTPSDFQRALRLLGPLGALLALALSSLACSVGGIGDINGFVLDRSYSLKDGEQLEGDQVVFAYDIEFQPDSVIDGDLTLTANDVVFDATVQGDVLVVAEHLTVGDSAFISGDLVACVNSLEQQDAARIQGEVREECLDNNAASIADAMDTVWNSWRDSIFFRLSTVFIGALLFGALAALGTVAIPRVLARMSQSVQGAPLVTGGVGVITVLILIGLTLLYALMLKLVVPLVLLPVVLLLWLALLLLSLLGWLALAEPFGVFLLRILRADRQPRMITAAVGGMVLALLLRLWSVFWLTPLLAVLSTALFIAIGLGPVLLTRLGTQPYTRSGVYQRVEG